MFNFNWPAFCVGLGLGWIVHDLGVQAIIGGLLVLCGLSFWIENVRDEILNHESNTENDDSGNKTQKENPEA